jgi:hypothetical protein
VSGGRRGGCDEDQDQVGGAIGRDIVGCWRSLLAPQQEGTIGCSANLHLIGENRARRGHNLGVIGSNTASAGADAYAAGPTGCAADRSGEYKDPSVQKCTEIVGHTAAAAQVFAAEIARLSDLLAKQQAERTTVLQHMEKTNDPDYSNWGPRRPICKTECLTRRTA